MGGWPACSPMFGSAQVAELEHPVVSLHVESHDLSVDFKIDLILKPQDSENLHRLLLAAAGSLEHSCTPKVMLLNKRFQRSFEKRQERHIFYSKLAEKYEQIACQMNHMRHDYFREIDRLRQELLYTKTNPRYSPGNVCFYDPALYKVPTWQEIVEQLDDLRTKREILWLGGSRESRCTQTDSIFHCTRFTQTREAHSHEVATTVRDQSVHVACSELSAASCEALNGQDNALYQVSPMFDAAHGATGPDAVQKAASQRCCHLKHRRTASEPCTSEVPRRASTPTSATMSARDNSDSANRNSLPASKKAVSCSRTIGDASSISVQLQCDDGDAVNMMGTPEHSSKDVAPAGPKLTDDSPICSKWELRPSSLQKRQCTAVEETDMEEKGGWLTPPSRQSEQCQIARQGTAVQCQLVDISNLEEAAALNSNFVYMARGRRIALPRLKNSSRSQRRASCSVGGQ